jgi:hypothetical protein
MARRAERWAVGAVVLLIHVLLLWTWRFVATPTPRERGPSAAPTITVLRLIPAQAPAPEMRDAAPPPAAVPTVKSGQTAQAKRDAPRPAAPQAITVLASPELAASAPAATPRELELSLPRAVAAPAQQTMKDQMRNDPRANSPRRSIETRVAEVSGTTAMTEERMDDTKTRLRQNGSCIEVHVSRDAQTNPWNQNHAPTPKLVKPSC